MYIAHWCLASPPHLICGHALTIQNSTTTLSAHVQPLMVNCSVHYPFAPTVTHISCTLHVQYNGIARYSPFNCTILLLHKIFVLIYIFASIGSFGYISHIISIESWSFAKSKDISYSTLRALCTNLRIDTLLYPRFISKYALYTSKHEFPVCAKCIIYTLSAMCDIDFQMSIFACTPAYASLLKERLAEGFHTKR